MSDMSNMAKISIKDRRNEMVSAISSLNRSLGILKNQTGEYAKQHRVLIETYSKVVDVYDEALEEIT